MYCDLPDQWCFEFILIILTVIFLFSSSLRLQTTSDVSLINNDCYFVNLAGFFFLSFLRSRPPGPPVLSSMTLKLKRSGTLIQDQHDELDWN